MNLGMPLRLRRWPALGAGIMLAVAFFIGLAAGPDRAYAAVVPDRTCDPPIVGFAVLQAEAARSPQAAQVFFAFHTGPLVRLSLYGYSGVSLQSVVVELRTVAHVSGDFLPSDAVLATTTVSGSALPPPTGGWFDANFATPATVTADQLYAVVVTPQPVAGQTVTLSLSFGLGCDLGPTGGLMNAGTGSPWFTVYQSSQYLFRSYVDVTGATLPAPGSPLHPTATLQPALPSPPPSVPSPLPLIPAPPVFAGIVTAIDFQGRVTVDRRPAPEGAVVRALINGMVCGEARVTADGRYAMAVASDLGRSGCGTEGATVRFTVDARPAQETAAYAAAPRQRTQDLTVTVASPAP